jgi:hypothetical protein
MLRRVVLCAALSMFLRSLLGQGSPETADPTAVCETLVERDLITRAPGDETSQSTLAAIDSTVRSNEQPVTAGRERVERR